jgi:hypothetical protein
MLKIKTTDRARQALTGETARTAGSRMSAQDALHLKRIAAKIKVFPSPRRRKPVAPARGAR